MMSEKREIIFDSYMFNDGNSFMPLLHVICYSTLLYICTCF